MRSKTNDLVTDTEIDEIVAEMNSRLHPHHRIHGKSVTREEIEALLGAIMQ